MMNVSRIINYIKETGHNPYSDEKLTNSDIFYIDTLADHYKTLSDEIESVIKDSNVNSVLELGSYMAVGSHLAREAGIKEIISKNKKNNGCIAIASELERPSNLEEFFTLFSEQGLEYPPLVILDGITDPRNLGAIFRNVDATGFGGIIAPMDNSAPINDLVVRTSCGATDTVFYVRVINSYIT